ncbi:unnamed protein product [Penicillium salamii]|nr:unnamed protein product [Penicillium salamii]
MDWNSFIRDADPQVQADYSKGTRDKVREARNAFRKFTSHLNPPDHTFWLKSENLTLRVIEGFFRWYNENHNLAYQSGFLTMTRFWRMWICEETGNPLPRLLSRQVTNGAKEQPPINIDDLLYTTWHLLAACDISFSSFRILLQLNALRKMMCSSTARPRTLIESNAHENIGDALK